MLLGIVCALAFAGSAAANQQTGAEKPEEQQPPIWKPGQTRSVELFPAGEVYPVYVADPHRPTNQLATAFYYTIEIPETRSPRTTLAGGGRFGILRIDSTAPEGRSWQISIDAGLDAVFDSQVQERRYRLGW